MSVGFESGVPPELFRATTPISGRTGDVRRGSNSSSPRRRMPPPCTAAVITGGRCGEVTRTFGSGDDHRNAAVAFLAAIEQPQHGFDDPPRVLVILEV